MVETLSSYLTGAFSQIDLQTIFFRYAYHDLQLTLILLYFLKVSAITSVLLNLYANYY